MSSNPPSALQTFLEFLGNLADLETFADEVRVGPQSMFQAMRLINARNQNLRQTNEELQRARMRIAELEQSSASQNSIIESCRNQISLLTQAIRDTQVPLRSMGIPDPAVFKERELDFLKRMNYIFLKWQFDNDHFLTEQKKVAYMYYRLDPLCQAHLHNLVKSETISITSSDEMMVTLGEIIDDNFPLNLACLIM